MGARVPGTHSWRRQMTADTNFAILKTVQCRVSSKTTTYTYMLMFVSVASTVTLLASFYYVL